MRLGRTIFVVVLAAGAVFSIFAQETDWYQGKIISDIVFEGLQHVGASEIEGVVAPYKGKPFNDDMYWEILGRLYALEYFDDIKPTAVRADPLGAQVILRFTVTERPIVSRITFSGNSNLRRAELLDVISLKTNDVVNQVKLHADEIALFNKYLEKGFPDVKVRSETQPGSNGSLQVTFFIEEGERITIDELRFEGNSVFSTRTLRGQLSLKTKGIINDGAFQEAKLLADRDALKQYYHDRGYIDAEVVDVIRDVKKDDKGNNSLAITFKIYEGRIYNFGGITFEGHKIFTTEQLQARVYSKTGDTVNERRVQGDLQRVADLYYENGYIFNRVDPQTERDTGNGVISYHVVIVERGRAHIENLRVTGNIKTKDYVIFREIALEPGDVFSKAKLMDGVRNLFNLQYFTAVVPDVQPGSEESLMDLVVTVEEQPTMDIQLGITFSGTSDPDAFPISGMVKWGDRNFLGTGNVVGTEFTASLDTILLSLNYTHRWIFGLPLSANFDLSAQWTKRQAAMDSAPPFFHGDEAYAYPDGFASYEEYVNSNKLPSTAFRMIYDQWRVSLGVSTGYRWSTFLGNLGLGGGLRVGGVYADYDESLYRPFDPLLRRENHRWTPATSIWTSLSLDQRDLTYDPSRGYYGIQRLGYYGILDMEQEHYIRSDTKAEFFVTLLNLPISETFSFKTIFGIHSGLSFIFKQPWYNEPRIEEANRLAVDGMFIGRGWSSEYRNKGLALWENWAELRVPLVPGILAWDFFLDAAGIREDFSAFFNDFNTDFLRFSMGGGLRFTIPQFPFRFSLAKRFKFVDGNFQWVGGPLFAGNDPNSGMDFVISFALSTY